MNYTQAEPGHYYAVGVGPGAPDLLTLRAVRLIETADVVIAPRSRVAHKSVSRQIIADYLNDRQEVIEHVYAMERDTEKTYSSWRDIAGLVASRCEADKSVVQVTLGDPLIYSTSCYLIDCLQKHLERDRIHVVPGISAFQATASVFHEVLALQEDRMILMPATDIDVVEHAMEHCETLVLYKCGKRVKQLAELLDRKGLHNRAALACYIEQEDRQFLTHDLMEAAKGEHGYLATVIVRVRNKAWEE